MKAKSSIIGFVAVLFATAWTAPAPNAFRDENKTVAVDRANEDDFAFIRVTRQPKGVTAAWGVNSTRDIQAFLLQKTYDDPGDDQANWEDVTSVSNNGARSYEYTDKKILPGYINYRILALKTDNSSKVSDIVTARITGIAKKSSLLKLSEGK